MIIWHMLTKGTDYYITSDVGQHQIHFPRRFIWLLRLLGGLPVSWWLRLGRSLLLKRGPL